MEKKIETALLVDAIYKKYGYDFRNYQQASIQNRFDKHMKEKGLTYISELIPLVLHDRKFFNNLLLDISVTVTEMFRDPFIYRAIRKKVVPNLRTYPYINVWHAGCATGQEAYSSAILFKEEEMLNRTQLYATDINDKSLQIAKKGIYHLNEMKQYTTNYNESDGKGSLSEFYSTSHRSAKMNKILIDKITFASHNLASDGVFAEMNLILCKNVLIYFNKHLQNRVLKLFTDSLCHRGYLCLGDKESLDFSNVKDQYEVVDSKARIYRKLN